MKIKSLLLTLCLLLSMGASARSLVVELQDGTLVYFLLSADASPTMNVADGQVTIEGNEYAFAEVKRFYISEEDVPTAIDGKKTTEETEMKNGVLYVSTTEPVGVYTTDGRLVQKGGRADAVRSTVSTESLPAGVYVIRYGKKSFKFIKR